MLIQVKNIRLTTAQISIFRYSRASKNQLRPYEKCATGDIDHKATIKEYSRSSADQQIAHLHELRPSNVLQTAMNHLLCNAIGQAHDMFSRIFRIRINEFLVLIFSNAQNWEKMSYLTNKRICFLLQLHVRNIGEKIRRFVFKKFVKTCHDSIIDPKEKQEMSSIVPCWLLCS